MAYQALYRAFRPQRFDELVGQDVIAQTLKNALRQNRLAHAYLFCGPRGTGKTSTAKILAKAVNCLDLQDGEPCGKCANCTAIAEERFIDVAEIDAASNRGIDEMRELKEQVRFVPSIGARKVYIIDEVHMLTTEAFNALLKTLEEPPAHVLFILATTDPQKVPPTVLSRTQRFDFKRIAPRLIIDQLAHIAEEEGVSVEADALSLIAQSAAGGLRDAVSLLDQAISFAGDEIREADVLTLLGGIGDKQLLALTQALAAHDAAALFETARDALDAGADAKALVRSLAAWLRRLFLAKVSPERRLQRPLETDAKALAESFSVRQYEGFLRALSNALTDMRFAPDAQLVLEVALIDLLLQAAQEQNVSPATAPSFANLREAPHTAVPQRTPPQTRPAAPPTPPPATAERPRPSERTAPTSRSAAAEPVREPSPTAQKVPPAEPPGATPQPAATADAADAFADVDLPNLWQQVMDGLRKESIRLHAFMKPARLISLENGLAVLNFAAENEFHFNQMNNPDHLALLASLFKDALGVPVKVQLTIDQRPDKTADIIATTERLFGKENVFIIDDD